MIDKALIASVVALIAALIVEAVTDSPAASVVAAVLVFAVALTRTLFLSAFRVKQRWPEDDESQEK